MVERSLGVREADGSFPSAPTNTVCVNCQLPLGRRFKVIVFDPDGGETVIRNRIVEERPGAVTVALHNSCAGPKKVNRARCREARAKLRRPSFLCDRPDVSVVHGGRLYTVKNIRFSFQGRRVLLLMPQTARK